MKYFSTRGCDELLGFEDVVLRGLAPDGGLYIPETIPSLPEGWETDWSGYTFQQLAKAIISLYISPSEIPADALGELVDRSYATFRHAEVTPVREVDGVWVLELWHGPTFAFKDVALQFLGNLFEYFLKRRNEKGGKEWITVVGATSGDTGSAAIYGLRGKANVEVFILHPQGRISPIQEAQMTSVLDANVHNIAVKGTFDDCQLGIGTNENDILARFWRTGRYEKEGDVKATLSPAMDIVVSSNFERLLWYLAYEGDRKAACGTVGEWMGGMKANGRVVLPVRVVERARKDFVAERVSDEETCSTIKKYFDKGGYVVDPHSAVGLCAAEKMKRDQVQIVLSTAHPGKFSEAVERALGEVDALPGEFRGLLERPRRVITVGEPSLVRTVISEVGRTE
ncbi:threonine synthase [Tulasnella sp. 403]|nr:threonine synthase [Tulasnella sp. 403]